MLALQRLFVTLDLNDNDAPANAAELIGAFGWGDSQAWVQHDIQEFCRVLLDVIDTSISSSPLTGSINQLFGQCTSYCAHVFVPSLLC